MNRSTSLHEEAQRKKEEWDLEVFLELHPIGGTRLIDDLRIPDFRFEMPDKRVLGIEHTEMRRARAAELHGFQRSIVARAQRRAEAAGIPPLQVTVTFHNYWNRYSSKGENAVEALFELVRDNVDSVLRSGSARSIRLALPRSPHHGTTDIRVIPGTVAGRMWLDHHRWAASEVGFVDPDPRQTLIEVVRSKEDKIESYRQHCDRCLLLIVVERRKADQKFELTPLRGYAVVSLFDAVFLLDSTTKDLLIVSAKDDKAT